MRNHRSYRPYLGILVVLSAVTTGQLPAQELATVPPESVGLSSARLERITDNLDQMIEQEPHLVEARRPR